MNRDCIKENIKTARLIYGPTQEKFSELMDVSPDTVYKWEHGKRTPDIDKIEKFSEMMKVSINQFINEELKDNHTKYNVNCISFSFLVGLLLALSIIGRNVLLLFIGSIIGILYMLGLWRLEKKRDKCQMQEGTFDFNSNKNHPNAKELLLMGSIGSLPSGLVIGLSFVPRIATKLLNSAADQACFIMVIVEFWACIFCFLEVIFYESRRKRLIQKLNI